MFQVQSFALKDFRIIDPHGKHVNAEAPNVFRTIADKGDSMQNSHLANQGIGAASAIIGGFCSIPFFGLAYGHCAVNAPGKHMQSEAREQEHLQGRIEKASTEPTHAARARSVCKREPLLPNRYLTALRLSFRLESVGESNYPTGVNNIWL